MDTRKNAALSSKFKLWFTEVYELGDAFKSYLNQEQIKPGQVLSVEQGLMILGHINKIDGLRLKIVRACMVARKNPEFFSETGIELNHVIGHAFKIIDENLLKKYENAAHEALEKYIESRKPQENILGFDGEIKINGITTSEQLLAQLNNPASKKIDKRYKARARWEMAINSILASNRRKNKAWSDLYESVENYYENIDAEVKEQVHKHVQDEYHALLKLHEHFIKWLNIFEEVMRITETDIKTLSGNLDDIANKRAKMIQMLIRGSATAALAPLFMSGFIDPAIAVVNDIVEKIESSMGNISINLNAQTIYNLTGFLPDPNKNTYKTAYNQLLNETIYDKIARYKKYLQHKIDSLSETTEFSEMMTKDSVLWENHTADDIIKSHRMAMIDAAHYEYSQAHMNNPADANSLISGMVHPFKTMIDETFLPMKSQYGTKENLASLHKLLDQVTFDDTVAGPEAVNKQHETGLIKYLSHHLAIYFIVKFLVENSRYFGGKAHEHQLHHAYAKLEDSDDSFGLKADDGPTEELVSALIKRILMTDNEALKAILELDASKPENEQIKACILTKYSFYSASRYRMKHCGSGCFFSSSYVPDGDHLKRRLMIKAIVDEYYNQDISELLQKRTVQFAQKLGITLGDPSQNHASKEKIIDAKWISENDLKKMVNEKIHPFIQEAEDNKKINGIFGSGGLSYYRNARLIQEAQHLRAIEISGNLAEAKKKTVKFNS